jgi:outer membrane protein TolC
MEPRIALSSNFFTSFFNSLFGGKSPFSSNSSTPAKPHPATHATTAVVQSAKETQLAARATHQQALANHTQEVAAHTQEVAAHRQEIVAQRQEIAAQRLQRR